MGCVFGSCFEIFLYHHHQTMITIKNHINQNIDIKISTKTQINRRKKNLLLTFKITFFTSFNLAKKDICYFTISYTEYYFYMTTNLR